MVKTQDRNLFPEVHCAPSLITEARERSLEGAEGHTQIFSNFPHHLCLRCSVRGRAVLRDLSLIGFISFVHRWLLEHSERLVV